MTPEASRWLWDRLNRPFDEVQVVRALLGLDEPTAHHLLARLVLGSEQAERLLEVAPQLIRVLRNEQGTLVRVEASIRGPILWPATISHRAASGFQDDLFVCASAVRNYDVAENRALAAALHELRRAGRQLDALGAEPSCRTHLALRSVARRASSLANHARLRHVATKRPSSRDLAKARSGTARVAYQPALDLLERISAGPALDDVAPFVDRRNAAHHDLLRTVVTALEAQGRVVAPFRSWRGELFSGHLRYLPPGERGAGQPAGVLLDDVAFVAAGPDEAGVAAALRRRHPHHRVVVVTEPEVVGHELSRGPAAPPPRSPGRPRPEPTPTTAAAVAVTPVTPAPAGR